MDNLQSTGENIHDKNDSQISELLLFGVSPNNHASDTCILNPTIQYILTTKYLTSVLLNIESFERFTFFYTYVNTTDSYDSSHKI